MVLEVKRHLRRTGKSLLFSASLFLAGTGCKSGPEPTVSEQRQQQQADWFDKQSGKDMYEPVSGPTAVRSQTPQSDQPPAKSETQTIVPVSNVTKTEITQPPLQLSSELQLQIVATIGTTPVYDREVREAVYMQHSDLFQLPAHERTVKMKQKYMEELIKIIERELIVDELFAMLTQRKQESTIKTIKEAASKEADGRMKDIQKKSRIPTQEIFKEFLQAQGLTVAGFRRHLERGFIMGTFIGEKVKPKIGSIGFVELYDYYQQHQDEFKTDDSVKWQDIFVRLDRFQTPADARKYAEWLTERVRNEQFAKLIELDQGDSKSRDGYGFGEKRGAINPPDLEATVFAMKPGDVTMVDFGSGYHIVRIAERKYAGIRPFDDKVQDEVRRKMTETIEKTVRRQLVETLWAKSQPQILVD